MDALTPDLLRLSRRPGIRRNERRKRRPMDTHYDMDAQAPEAKRTNGAVGLPDEALRGVAVFG
jgi:hypothetical protein